MSIVLTIGIPIFFTLFVFICIQTLIIIVGFKPFKKNKFQIQNTTVLVPCYNEEEHISKCLESILKSDFRKKLQIIVIDDGSIDNTKKIISKYPVTLLKQEHKGKVDALNLGLQYAKYDYIVTLDADTILEKNSLKKLVEPLINKHVGSTTGMCRVANTQSILGNYAQIEYQFINSVRESFTNLTNTSIWFFGFFAAYKKSVLKQIGGFSKHTLTEDMDSCLAINSLGLDVMSVRAYGKTFVPQTVSQLIKQRIRWWIGSLQNLAKHRKIAFQKSAITFLFVNQYWWSFFAVVSLPFMIYQFIYWLPAGLEIISYTLRWLSLAGPIYVIYKIPEWGISWYGFFGVLAGIVSSIMLLISIIKQRAIKIKTLIGIFLYFPYTIIINLITTLAVFKYPFSKNKFFKK